MKQVFYTASLHQVCTNVCPRSVNVAIHTHDKRDWLIKVPATWTVNTTTSTTVVTVSTASLQEWPSMAAEHVHRHALKNAKHGSPEYTFVPKYSSTLLKTAVAWDPH